MAIAYVSIDEVNQDIAYQLANGRTLEVLSPGDPVGNDLWDAEIYDLDYLPANYREEILDELCSWPPDVAVAVHGYSLDEKQRKTLRQNGVLVARRLSQELVNAVLQQSAEFAASTAA